MHDLQKAGVFKRFSAFLCDAVLFLVLALGILLVGLIVTNYDTYANTVNESREYYEKKYGDEIIYPESLEALSEEQKALYDAAVIEKNNDTELNYAYNMVCNLAIVLPAVSLLITFLILEFAIPLIFKNGQTVGKKIFGVGVMKVDGTKLTPQLLFVRTILGKYTMQTMVPVFILILVFLGLLGGVIGIGVIVLIGLLNLIVMCVTHTNSCIHDLLAYTVTVDLASQRIFENSEELLEYKKRLHAEAVESADY